MRAAASEMSTAVLVVPRELQFPRWNTWPAAGLPARHARKTRIVPLQRRQSGGPAAANERRTMEAASMTTALFLTPLDLGEHDRRSGPLAQAVFRARVESRRGAVV
jgi:hypothetical protein